MTAKTLQDIINIDSSKISISDFFDFLKNVDMEFPTPLQIKSWKRNLTNQMEDFTKPLMILKKTERCYRISQNYCK